MIERMHRRMWVGWLWALRCGCILGMAAAACGGHSSQGDAIPDVASAGASVAKAGNAAVGAGGRNDSGGDSGAGRSPEVDGPKPGGAGGAGTSAGGAGNAAAGPIARAGDGGDGGVGGEADDGSGDDAGASDGPATEVWSDSSSGGLVAVFLGKRGIYVVLHTELQLLDHDGSLLLSRPFNDSFIDVAAFDEERLIIGGTASVTTFDADLQLLRTIGVQGGCEGVVAVSKQRIVCSGYFGLTLLDGTNGTRLAGPIDVHVSQASLSGIPGGDAFLAAEVLPTNVHGSTAQLTMFRVTPDDDVLFFDQALVSELPGQRFYGFDGSRPPMLISGTGEQVALRPNCSVTADRASSPCFVSDNAARLIPAGRAFAAIAPGAAAHHFFGLIGTPDPNTSYPCSNGGCDLELIDDQDNRVLRQLPTKIDATHVYAFLRDAQAHAMVLALRRPPSKPGEFYRDSIFIQPF